MKANVWLCCVVAGILSAHALDTSQPTETKSSTATDSSVAADGTSTSSKAEANEASKDKRQISNKDTPVYPNHRTEAAVARSDGNDDPEVAQETIYGPKPNQFIIRPIAPHQHHQHESHQEPQLRNYAATNRPHAAQLLQERNQETQHYVYLQDITRNQPKAIAAEGQVKHQTPAKKQASSVGSSNSNIGEGSDSAGGVEEAEQRYAVAVQPQPRAYGPAPYQHGAQQQPTQPYQVIPEEQFLKLLEEELQARAYHDAQLHHQKQQQKQQQQQQQQQQQYHRQAQQAQTVNQIPTTSATRKVIVQQTEPGLGSYRERQHEQQEPDAIGPQYVQYVPQHQPPPAPLQSPLPYHAQQHAHHHHAGGGPKYLPQPHHQQAQQQQQQLDDELDPHQQQQQQQQLTQSLPPQIAYYQPQISYKTLPNHPLAKSSLENEIEKLLEANKQSALEFVDNSNEPSLVSHQHQPQHAPRIANPTPPLAAPVTAATYRQPKAYYGTTTPNSLLDANNQPFIPSLFKFSNFQQPTPIYPTQHLIGAKKLGPVVYPPSTSSPPAPPPTHIVPQAAIQPSQYYQYQEAPPTPAAVKTKLYRPKHFGSKIPTVSPAKSYDKSPSLLYEYERSPPPSSNFFPSPPDPLKHTPRPTPLPTQPSPLPPLPLHGNYPRYVLPQAHAPAPSQSSIYVAQGTGIASPTRATQRSPKPKTAEDVKQLHLPQPGGKPLTQAEFQALVEAGYPVTAVPVPVPVPYDQYVQEHPEYRNRPPVDYAHLMRLATRQFITHQRSLAAPSEPSAKIAAAPSEPTQTATAIGGGSVTYLRPIDVNQKRQPRDDKESVVPGAKSNKEAE